MKNKIVFFKNDIEWKDTYYYSVKDVRKVNLLDNWMIEDVLKIRKPTWWFMAKELMIFCQDVLEKRWYVLYRFYWKPAHKYIFMLKEMIWETKLRF
jgi:hypothetical protein